MKNNRKLWVILIVLAAVMGLCLMVGKSEIVEVDEYDDTFRTVDSNIITISHIDATLSVDPNIFSIVTYPSPPKPKYKCPVHGIIDNEKEFAFSITLVEEKIMNVCYRCYAEFIAANLPELIEIKKRE